MRSGLHKTGSNLSTQLWECCVAIKRKVNDFLRKAVKLLSIVSTQKPHFDNHSLPPATVDDEALFHPLAQVLIAARNRPRVQYLPRSSKLLEDGELMFYHGFQAFQSHSVSRSQKGDQLPVFPLAHRISAPPSLGSCCIRQRKPTRTARTS